MDLIEQKFLFFEYYWTNIFSKIIKKWRDCRTVGLITWIHLTWLVTLWYVTFQPCWVSKNNITWHLFNVFSIFFLLKIKNQFVQVYITIRWKMILTALLRSHINKVRSHLTGSACFSCDSTSHFKFFLTELTSRETEPAHLAGMNLNILKAPHLLCLFWYFCLLF